MKEMAGMYLDMDQLSVIWTIVAGICILIAATCFNLLSEPEQIKEYLKNQKDTNVSFEEMNTMIEQTGYVFSLIGGGIILMMFII